MRRTAVIAALSDGARGRNVWGDKLADPTGNSVTGIPPSGAQRRAYSFHFKQTYRYATMRSSMRRMLIYLVHLAARERAHDLKRAAEAARPLASLDRQSWPTKAELKAAPRSSGSRLRASSQPEGDLS